MCYSMELSGGEGCRNKLKVKFPETSAAVEVRVEAQGLDSLPPPLSQPPACQQTPRNIYSAAVSTYVISPGPRMVEHWRVHPEDRRAFPVLSQSGILQCALYSGLAEQSFSTKQ